MRLRTAAIGLVLASVTLGSTALTLGKARGAAWIGQPLELAVSVQLEPGQPANSLCAEADVFYADSKLEPGRVQVAAELGVQPDTAIIRIASTALIDEPVVTVYLRAGCTAKTTRRYVLLADYASENVTAPVRSAEPPAPVPVVTPVATPPPESKPVVTLVTTGNATSAVAAPVARATPRPDRSQAMRERKPAPERDSVKQRKAPPEPKVASSGRARLKLDPIENLAERIKTLEATTTAAPLEEMVRDSQRIAQLQGDVKALLTQASKNEANLAAMRERLDRAESERIPAILLYALLALVGACVAAIVVLWNRRDPSAWRAGVSEADGPANVVAQSASALVTRPERENSPQPASGAAAPAPLTRQGKPYSDPMDLGHESFEKYVTVETPLSATDSQIMDFGDSNLIHPDFNSSSMYDLRQQAEFFAHLGKTDEAIESLEKRIRANGNDCPLVYLELLRIANQHSLKTDFRQFRDEFMQVFNANVPEFALFRDEGKGLEAHAGVLSHISQLWPSPTVLDVIEACVLISPNEKNATRFDLAAFRDLVLLHGLVYHQIYGKSAADSSEHMDSEHVTLDF